MDGIRKKYRTTYDPPVIGDSVVLSDGRIVILEEENNWLEKLEQTSPQEAKRWKDAIAIAAKKLAKDIDNSIMAKYVKNT